MFEEIDTHDILPIIEKLDTKKATGNDQISTRAIKDNKMVFAPILVFLINFVIESSIFPDCLKIAWVKPIFKKGDKYNAITLAPFQFWAWFQNNGKNSIWTDSLFFKQS